MQYRMQNWGVVSPSVCCGWMGGIVEGTKVSHPALYNWREDV